MRRVLATIVAVEKQWVLHSLSVCICSLSYPACNAHVPYCHQWPARFYNILPHYLINGTIFEKKLLNTKCVFSFFIQSLSETFLILRRNERDMIKNVYWSCKVPFTILPLLWHLNFLDIFSKNSEIPNFMKIRPVGAELFIADGQTAGMMKLMVALHNFAKACRNLFCRIWY